MTARPGTLALAAVVVTGTAMLVAGAEQSSAPTPQPRTKARAARAETTVAPPATADPVITAARAYALSARNWTPATYRRAWQRELALSGGAYRRQLRAARPTDEQLDALKTDAAASTATISRIQRDTRAPASHPRVLIWLSERTTVAGQTIIGTTHNEVHLHRADDGRWRVTAWTALPGAERTP